MQRSEDENLIKQARNHGHDGRDECAFWSINSRLDELHAAFLKSMLDTYHKELHRRVGLADIYRRQLGGIVDFPKVSSDSWPSYNWMMILAERRDELISYLAKHGIEAKIHYPKLIPELKAASCNCRSHGELLNAKRKVKQILSLPMSEHITEFDVHVVCNQIKSFYLG
jgi:dTDP-4-amino-4,6-dideoxygalactose transaminase